MDTFAVVTRSTLAIGLGPNIIHATSERSIRAKWARRWPLSEFPSAEIVEIYPVKFNPETAEYEAQP